MTNQAIRSDCSRHFSPHLPSLLVCCAAGKPKQKAMGKAVKTPSLTWMEALPPPPPLEELEPRGQDEEPPLHEEMDLG